MEFVSLNSIHTTEPSYFIHINMFLAQRQHCVAVYGVRTAASAVVAVANDNEW